MLLFYILFIFLFYLQDCYILENISYFLLIFLILKKMSLVNNNF